MDFPLRQAVPGEFAAAYLQVLVTLGLFVLCAVLWRRYGKAYFLWWSLAWVVYGTRLGAILSFSHTGSFTWLYWHQVTTGWTALALLWAALVFSQRAGWRWRYLILVAFPPVWSYLAIYRLDNFLLAAGPVVIFLSAATAWTAWAFYRYDRDVGSPAARVLATALALWAVHHLDYPFLRARGAWNPWGYYLDIVFQMGTGLGILLLVLEDLDQGLRSLTALSGELQQRSRTEESVSDAVLRRALGLRGVHGAALHLSREGGRFTHGAGVAALWPHETPPDSALEAVRAVEASGRPEVVQGPGPASEAGDGRRWIHPYTAALPVLRAERVVGSLVVVGEARDPFTALDAPFLQAFGAQVGAALENEDLYRSLEDRTEELERLQTRMVRQHEEERNRLSRELHDETAQVLAALNMQLGLLQTRVDETSRPTLDRARALVGDGIRSIRSVTRNLRPTVLDDLGLVPALRALTRDFQADSTLQVTLSAPSGPPRVAPEAELALYRTFQEALANAVRHGECSRVEAHLGAEEGEVVLRVADDGVGFPTDHTGVLNRTRGGLAGIRERITGVGGAFEMRNPPEGGAEVVVRVPTLGDPSDAPLPSTEDKEHR